MEKKARCEHLMGISTRKRPRRCQGSAEVDFKYWSGGDEIREHRLVCKKHVPETRTELVAGGFLWTETSLNEMVEGRQAGLGSEEGNS